MAWADSARGDRRLPGLEADARFVPQNKKARHLCGSGLSSAVALEMVVGPE
ncbi:hypothetical protein [Xylophilus ampelinus]|uniref:hypothetical protein n=1 Tax=Xylophilus ampelinus TaxID=54067 RepID=UPI0018F1A095|nr:hypothetical protein [Xylophilus ampelinus]